MEELTAGKGSRVQHAKYGPGVILATDGREAPFCFNQKMLIGSQEKKVEKKTNG